MIIHGFLIDPSLETIEVVRVDNALNLYGCFLMGKHVAPISLMEESTESIPWNSLGDRIHYCEPKPGDVSFQVAGVLQPIFGRGLILGHDSQGLGLNCGPRVAYIQWLHRVQFDNGFMIPFEKVAS